MTLEDFIEINPNNYGTGNANLFYSSSVSGSENVPVSPFEIQGISMPIKDKNSNQLTTPLKEVTSFKFDFGGVRVNAPIISSQQKNDYFFFQFTPFTVTSLPSTLVGGNKVEIKSEFNFLPYFETNYFNSDYNPLQGNSTALLQNSATQVVDRNTSQQNPSNLDAVIAQTAKKAEIVDSFYETAGLVSGKYRGAKLTNATSLITGSKQALTRHVLNNGISGSEPALSFTTFEGSAHESDVSSTNIKALSERIKTNVYFNAIRSGSGTDTLYPSFPFLGSIIFLQDEETKRFRKAASSKLYSIEQDQVFTTNISGVVTLVE